jgi:hypothetical protein
MVVLDFCWFANFVSAVAGKRLTYDRLTQGKTWFDADSLTEVQ